MFSSKVITAVEILLSLEVSERDVRDCRHRDGTDISPLLADKDRQAVNWDVLRKLMAGGYIACTDKKHRYVLLREPSGITLLHLVTLFHGDVCLGETYDHQLTLGREDFHTASCRNLRAWETALHTRLRERLQQAPITRFRKK